MSISNLEETSISKEFSVWNLFKVKIFTEKFGKRLMVAGGLSFLVAIALFCWKTNDFSISKPIDSERFDHFGSFVAGVAGTLWSLASVVLFYVALKGQKEDFLTNHEVLKKQADALTNQVGEFKQQRETLVQTKEVFLDQSSTLKTQQFDSTFFNTFRLLTNITTNITYLGSLPLDEVLKQNTTFKYLPNGLIFQGKNSFRFFYKELETIFKKKYSNYILQNLRETYIPNQVEFNVTQEIHEDLVHTSYEEVFQRYQADLGHYFRTMYNLVKFVDKQKPTNPQYYIKLIGAQLSSYEHLLLFYNCFTEYGEEKFMPLVIKYRMLDNMPISKLLNPIHKNFYPKEAY